MSVALYSYDELSNDLNYYNRHNRYADCWYNSNDDDDDDDDDDGGAGDGDGGVGGDGGGDDEM